MSPRARMDGASFEPLIADLDAALAELTAPVERDPGLWTHGRAGHWTAGQHVDHLATALTVSGAALERRLAKLRDGTLRPPRRRGPAQALFVHFAVGGGWLPRGARSPSIVRPADHPERAEVLARITRELAHHRALGAALTPDERERLWVPNPFLPRWHYNYPELLRMHAVHARHHARQVEELAATA